MSTYIITVTWERPNSGVEWFSDWPTMREKVAALSAFALYDVSFDNYNKFTGVWTFDSNLIDQWKATAESYFSYNAAQDAHRLASGISRTSVSTLDGITVSPGPEI